MGLFLPARRNHLLYHSSVELLAVTVSIAIFGIGWNARQFAQNGVLLLLSVAYPAVGVLDTLHTVAYKGRGVFLGWSGHGVDEPDFASLASGGRATLHAGGGGPPERLGVCLRVGVRSDQSPILWADVPSLGEG